MLGENDYTNSCISKIALCKTSLISIKLLRILYLPLPIMMWFIIFIMFDINKINLKSNDMEHISTVGRFAAVEIHSTNPKIPHRLYVAQIAP